VVNVKNEVIHGDWLNNNIPDKSVDLIMADPPYFEVKGDFDFIWSSFDDYLKDVEKWAIECKRVLKDNGSLFWWGNVEKIAYSQIILDKYFKFENNITWHKPDSMQYQYYSVDTARRFTTNNERVLFYTTGREPEEWSITGLEYVEEKFIKPQNPFALYLRSEFKKAKVTNKEVSKLFPSKTGGLTGCVSNWLNGDNVITEEQYLKVRAFLNGEYLRKEYEDLRKEYEKLRLNYKEIVCDYELKRKEYEDLRRPFNNTYNLSDIITNSQESNVSRNYKHDTQKALTLIKKLIQTTTRENATVLIPFGGSGTDVEACISTNRNYICFEIDEKHYNTIKEREKKCLDQGELFSFSGGECS
jgi:site-specific DNA-methyltransferase (adenine-specific)